MKRTLLLAALLLLPAALAAQAPFPGAGETVLSPGDVIRIAVWNKPELSGEFTVAEDGTIAHPVFRHVRVAGIGISTVEARVLEVLAEWEKNPRLVLEPLLQVGVGGEVRLPGLLPLHPHTSIAQAVARAGGPTERAILERVRLYRGAETIEVDLTRPTEGIAGSPIRSGDQIFVERRSSFWRDNIAPSGSIVAGIGTILALILR